jgi:hypothetical protein
VAGNLNVHGEPVARRWFANVNTPRVNEAIIGQAQQNVWMDDPRPLDQQGPPVVNQAANIGIRELERLREQLRLRQAEWPGELDNFPQDNEGDEV